VVLRKLLRKTTIDDFSKKLVAMKYINQQDYDNIEDKPTVKYAPITLHNNQGILLKFLNFCADLYDVKPIEMTLKTPQYGSKYFLSAIDIQKILEYQPENQIEADVLDICIFNKDVGLRISEVLGIQKENIICNSDCIEIRFLETKKNKNTERSIIIVEPEGINVIKKHMLNAELWCFRKYSTFDKHIKLIAAKVFKDETIKVFKVDTENSEYQTIKKSKLISSHAIRRLAIETNIVRYGIDVARSFSGHRDFQMITRHYSRFMQAQDLKNKLLKNRI
jgi:integrase